MDFGGVRGCPRCGRCSIAALAVDVAQRCQGRGRREGRCVIAGLARVGVVTCGRAPRERGHSPRNGGRSWRGGGRSPRWAATRDVCPNRGSRLTRPQGPSGQFASRVSSSPDMGRVHSLELLGVSFSAEPRDVVAPTQSGPEQPDRPAAAASSGEH